MDSNYAVLFAKHSLVQRDDFISAWWTAPLASAMAVRYAILIRLTPRPLLPLSPPSLSLSLPALLCTLVVPSSLGACCSSTRPLGGRYRVIVFVRGSHANRRAVNPLIPTFFAANKRSPGPSAAAGGGVSSGGGFRDDSDALGRFHAVPCLLGNTEGLLSKFKA